MNNYLLLISAVLSNFVFFFLCLELNGLSTDNLYKIKGDSIGYVESSESLINDGVMIYKSTANNKEFISNFKEDLPINKGLLYAFRTPGFTFFYYPLRLLFNQNTSLIIFLFFQVIITAIGKYILQKTVFKLTKNTTLSYICFALALITPYFTQFNNLLLTDSLGGAFFLFSVFSLLEWKSTPTVKRLLISGLFFSISFFLRPFLLLLLLPIWIFILVNSKYIFKKILINFIIFHSFFGLVELVWVARNYSHTHQFIPVATTLEFQNTKHKSFQALKKISSNKGMSMNWWDSKSPVNWYVYNDDFTSEKLRQEFSKSEFQLLIQSKKLFKQSLHPSHSKSERQTFETVSENLLNEIIKKQKETGVLNYFLIPRTKNVFTFINQTSHKIFATWKYPFNVVLHGTQILIFKTIIYLGILFSLIALISKRSNEVKLIASIPFILLVFFAYFNNNIEDRYLFTSFPFLFMMSFIGFKNFLKKGILYKSLTALTLIISITLSVTELLQVIKW